MPGATQSTLYVLHIFNSTTDKKNQSPESIINFIRDSQIRTGRTKHQTLAFWLQSLVVPNCLSTRQEEISQKQPPSPPSPRPVDFALCFIV